MKEESKNEAILRWQKMLSKEEFASKFPLENNKIEIETAIKISSKTIKNKLKQNENNSSK